MRRRAWVLALSCTLPGLAAAQRVVPGTLPPLPHVQVLGAQDGQPLLLKSVSCQAEGKPETLGRLYLRDLPGRRVQVARVEYNEQGKYIIEHGASTPKVKESFDRYVTYGQPFSTFTLGLMTALWRAFGLKFSLDNVTYHCRLLE